MCWVAIAFIDDIQISTLAFISILQPTNQPGVKHMTQTNSFYSICRTAILIKQFRPSPSQSEKCVVLDFMLYLFFLIVISSATSSFVSINSTHLFAVFLYDFSFFSVLVFLQFASGSQRPIEKIFLVALLHIFYCGSMRKLNGKEKLVNVCVKT